MYGLAVIKHPLNDKPLSKVLVDDLCERALLGKVIVAAENPSVLLSAVRKQWLRNLYRLRVEHASLLDSAAKQRLATRISWLERLTFTAQKPEDMLNADITFATAEDLANACPQCKIALVTYTFPREQLHMLTVWMPPSGIVVIYEG